MGSTDPYEMVNNVPLGPNAVVMRVAKVINGKAFLWRPTSDMTTMSDAVNEKIAWPLHNVSVIKVPEDEGEASVRRPSLSPSGSTSSTVQVVKRSASVGPQQLRTESRRRQSK
ncbi:uncharacterized protein LOC125594708 [Brassica napus]|uniref:uncharacterized protein LOC125594708 n=1 Tax=Brassica napus TaxID=3708 RepID=UPI002078B666|nr:uncharacterized protein LOC125594708 [Brassica napus]